MMYFQEEKTMTKNKGYYNPDVIKKFQDALFNAIEDIKAKKAAGKPYHVTISNGNSKMGSVPSVSLLPFITCPARCGGTCGVYCYAAKLANLRPSVLRSYAKNTAILIVDPARYWADIEAEFLRSRWFRFHVSGDIPNMTYFEKMMNLCKKYPETRVLAFTKRYETVNKWIDLNGPLPENMSLLFSTDPELKALNPHGLPETIVYERHEMPRPPEGIRTGPCLVVPVVGFLRFLQKFLKTC